MKTQLPESLPEEKRKQIEAIKACILKTEKAEMIILYGSHARGDFKDEKVREIGGYMIQRRSDYDILVVIDQPDEEREIARYYDGFAPPKMIGKTESEIRQQCRGLGLSVQIIVEQIRDLNWQLKEKQYFYSDIIKEGVLLYDSGKCLLVHPPEEPDPAVRLKHAEENFEGWMRSAKDFWESSLDDLKAAEKRYRNASFHLEQVCEMCYKCLLLVYSHYAPDEHNLYKLRDQVEKFEPALTAVFPMESKEQQNHFDKLNLAYIGARYIKTFSVTEEEVNYWQPQVKKLMEVTKASCEEKLKQLAGNNR